MTYDRLRRFILSEMQMAHVYQPVMLRELLKNSGRASVREVAQALLNKDPTQVEYFSLVVKRMVGKVLTNNRGITEKNGDQYVLKGVNELTSEQVSELIRLCEGKISEFEEKRGNAIWSHRRRGHRPISGSIVSATPTAGCRRFQGTDLARSWIKLERGAACSRGAGERGWGRDLTS